jgi:hypothetical protein
LLGKGAGAGVWACIGPARNAIDAAMNTVFNDMSFAVALRQPATGGSVPSTCTR